MSEVNFQSIFLDRSKQTTAKCKQTKNQENALNYHYMWLFHSKVIKQLHICQLSKTVFRNLNKNFFLDPTRDVSSFKLVWKFIESSKVPICFFTEKIPFKKVFSSSLRREICTKSILSQWIPPTCQHFSRWVHTQQPHNLKITTFIGPFYMHAPSSPCTVF